jgi:hypothetical protein
VKSTRAAEPARPLLIGSDEADDTRLPSGILVGIGSLAIIVAGFVASAMPAGDPAVRYGVLVVTVFGFAALRGRWTATLSVAGIGFLVFNGFLVNQLGELSWHGWADAARIAALGAATIFGRLLGDIYRSSGKEQSVPTGPMVWKQLIKEETHDA